MIAQTFKSYETKDDIIIFASGVSDSTHATNDSFEREKKLLNQSIEKASGKLLVYFSTCSIYDHSMQQSAYVNHKKAMEQMIMEKQDGFIIFRLSNPLGNTQNKTTIINYLIKNIIEQKPFEAWRKASRNVIDIDDMYLICREIIDSRLFRNQIVNVANPSNYSIPFIIEAIEKHFNIKAVYTALDKGDSPQIDTSQVEPLFKKFNINFETGYLNKLLQKYFPV